MRVLKFLLKCMAYFFAFILLTIIIVELIAQLNIKYDLNKEDTYVAEIINNKLELSEVKDAKNLWFDKEMSIENTENNDYNAIYVEILYKDKPKNEETLKVTNIAADYTNIYTYKIKNGEVIPISLYSRFFGLMPPAMAVSFFILLIFYFLYPVIRNRLTINRIVR